MNSRQKGRRKNQKPTKNTDITLHIRVRPVCDLRAFPEKVKTPALQLVLEPIKGR